MRVPGLLVGALMLTAGLAMALPPIPAASHALAAHELGWSARVGALVPALNAPHMAFHEQRDVPALIASVYARLGIPAPTSAQDAHMAGELRALDPRVASALQQLLGAVDLGIGDRERGDSPRAALRLLNALDAVTTMLGAAAAEAPPMTHAVPFPSQNEGILFNDPWSLVLIGGTGPSVYHGTTYVNLVAPETNLLTIDLGGNDVYYDHPGTAKPLPQVVCGPCHNGLPVSLTLDLDGDDQYFPHESSQNSGAIGLGMFGGIGILADLRGNDRYVNDPGQGAGQAGGIGLLLDAVGNDAYSGGVGSQGFAGDSGSIGLLMDTMGADTYQSYLWSRGFTFNNANALFFDGCGTDRYVNAPGENGATWQQTPMGYGIDEPIAC